MRGASGLDIRYSKFHPRHGNRNQDGMIPSNLILAAMEEGVSLLSVS